MAPQASPILAILSPFPQSVFFPAYCVQRTEEVLQGDSKERGEHLWGAEEVVLER